MLKRFLTTGLVLAILTGSGPVLAGGLDTIKSRGELVAGVCDFLSPFGFIDERSDRMVGFEVDLMRALARKLGARLNLVPLAGPRRLEPLLGGSVDIVAAAIEVGPELEERVDFSIVYLQSKGRFLVKKGAAQILEADSPQLKIGAAKGDKLLSRVGELYPKAQVVAYESLAHGFLALKKGEIAALAGELSALASVRIVDENPDLWETSGPELSRILFAAAVSENSSDLRDWVNRSLAAMWVSGEYKAIHDKWFGPDSDHPAPLDWEMTVWPD